MDDLIPLFAASSRPPQYEGAIAVYRRGEIPRPLARDTFGCGPKSVQKGRLNLRFKNPPALFFLQICCRIPRVRGMRLISFCMTYRLSSCAAAAFLFNGRTKKVVRYGYQRQRRGSRDDPFYESKKEIPCDRAAGIDNYVHIIARPEVKEPEVPSGVFAYFCHC